MTITRNLFVALALGVALVIPQLAFAVGSPGTELEFAL